MPWSLNRASTGSKLVALSFALSPRTLADPAFPARLAALFKPPRSPPSETPRLFAAASATLVLALIISRSCSAIAAKMWMVSRFA